MRRVLPADREDKAPQPWAAEAATPAQTLPRALDGKIQVVKNENTRSLKKYVVLVPVFTSGILTVESVKTIESIQIQRVAESIRESIRENIWIESIRIRRGAAIRSIENIRIRRGAAIQTNLRVISVVDSWLERINNQQQNSVASRRGCLLLILLLGGGAIRRGQHNSCDHHHASIVNQNDVSTSRETTM
jgi:hypothetical protein